MILVFLLRYGCQNGLKIKTIYAVIAARILRASHEGNIDIVLEWDFDHIPKIGNNLKTNEYLLIKVGQYMAKSHM